jgi:tripartite-type tricarboxylate transporter receptor subunit TctC
MPRSFAVRLVVLSLAFSGFVVQPAPVQAQTYPTRPITIVVAFPAGSATDVIARVIGRDLSSQLKQPVIIENKPGGGSIIGTRYAAKAPADGYTLILGAPSSFAIAPSFSASPLNYDPVKDFEPISFVGGSPFLLATSPKLGAKKFETLVQIAKSKPGALNYSSVGEGSVAHIGMLLLAEQAGLKMTHIPYKSSAQSIIDVAAGIIDLQLATIPPALSLHQAGKVDVLAITSAKRMSVLGEIPTVSESGIPGYEWTTWFAMFAPAGIPKDIRATLNSAMRKALQVAEVREGLVKQGIEPEATSPEELGEYLKKSISVFRRAIEKANLKPSSD